MRSTSQIYSQSFKSFNEEIKDLFQFFPIKEEDVFGKEWMGITHINIWNGETRVRGLGFRRNKIQSKFPPIDHQKFQGC
jgi:hypothetical protein